MPKKINLNINELAEYIKSHTIHETANYFKVSQNTINRNLWYNDINDRRPLFSADVSLIHDYIKTHTIKEAAKYFGTSNRTMRRRLSEYEIDERKNLANLYPNNLTETQQNMIIGWLLGDGCIPCEPKKPNKYFKFGQKLASLEYVEFVKQIMQPFSHDIKISRNKYYFYTCAIPLFTNLRYKWYKYPNKIKSKKLIPKDIKLNWETVAFWYVDDGTNYSPGKNLVLATCDFTNEDVAFLMYRLNEDLGIKTTTYFNSNEIYNPDHDKYPLIRIKSEYYFKFLDNVIPYVQHLKCFQYKLSYNNAGIKNLDNYVPKIGDDSAKVIVDFYNENSFNMVEIADIFQMPISTVQRCIQSKKFNPGYNKKVYKLSRRK